MKDVISYQVLLRVKKKHRRSYIENPNLSQLRRVSRAVAREFPVAADYHSYDENLEHPHLHLLVFVTLEKEEYWLSKLSDAIAKVDKHQVFQLLPPRRIRQEQHIRNTMNYQLGRERIHPVTPVLHREALLK